MICMISGCDHLAEIKFLSVDVCRCCSCDISRGIKLEGEQMEELRKANKATEEAVEELDQVATSVEEDTSDFDSGDYNPGDDPENNKDIRLY